MTLLDDCKALADDMALIGHDMRIPSTAWEKKLRAIIAKHEPGGWRGPWKCDRCGREFDKLQDIHFTPSTQDYEEYCTGTLVPYERRGGER